MVDPRMSRTRMNSLKISKQRSKVRWAYPLTENFDPSLALNSRTRSAQLESKNAPTEIPEGHRSILKNSPKWKKNKKSTLKIPKKLVN